ncbi:hypothetical protein C8R43DRAFT_1239423 [Mycena crocata]|nr:hypothetical protein C8R43DRAFT_1239423 [Mycena crocata]
MAAPDPTTLLPHALQQTQEASAQLASVTAERDRLRVQVNNAGKLNRLRLRILKTTEEALAAERRLFDERMCALRNAKMALQGSIRMGDTANRSHVVNRRLR